MPARHGPGARAERGARAQVAASSLGAALLALLCAAPAPAQDPSRSQGSPLPDDGFLESRPFSIPDKQGARVLYDAASKHVASGRWSEALNALETLIEDHAGSIVLLPPDSETARRSMQPVYRGAAQAARELFHSLPEDARAAFAERYGARAQELLARARASLDRTALTELARRYPATAAGRDAWWTLGDLEAEAGNLEAARSAWERGSATLPEPDGAEPLARRGAWDPGDAVLRAARPAHWSSSEERSRRATPPGGDAHSWESALRLDLLQPAPPFRSNDKFHAFPIVVGETVLASNSLSLVAVDALTGIARWRSAEAPGWDEVRAGNGVALNGSKLGFPDFFQGVDREGLMIAPAASAGIAVAALQIPITVNANSTFQSQIKIETVIPDRRLFAFDLATGKPLWNHLPPPFWNGDSGSFTDLMRVAGPPVISGSRILVPMWRHQGRIAYYVACYDLQSGAYLWSTHVASGQRSSNMFGRLEREFCAPPLVVEGDRVIALTQLGTLAALDVFTGETLWQTIYHQIPLPGADGIQASHRTALWRNAPPVVSEGVVVATPLDSTDMLAVDLESGAVLWELGASRIPQEGRASYNTNWCLLGIRDGLVYLGGRRVIALGSPQGLAGDRGPTTFYDSGPLMGDGYADATSLPRAVLSASHVIVPTRSERLALDLRDLKSRDAALSGDWGSAAGAEMGNLAIGEGSLFALSSQSLCGSLDWRSIEARLERDHAERPNDAALATRLAAFLRERAASEQGDSRPEAALEHLRRAQQILQPFAEQGQHEVRTALFEILVLESDVLVDDAQASRGLERLDRAVQLAPDRQRLARVLRKSVELLRTLQLPTGRSSERFEAALAQLDQQCGDLDFPPEARSGPAIEARSVRRWVREQRIAQAAATGDHAKELAALIDLLATCGDGPLSPAVAELEHETPAQRIEKRLATGARAAWQPFEAQARERFAAARDAGDAAALEALTRLYPHTQAARDARDTRLRLALDQGDAPAAVRTAFAELPAAWSALQTSPREAQLVWLAARALERDGNLAYHRSVLRRLARFQPSLVADERQGAESFASLSAKLPGGEAAPEPASPARFDAPAHEIATELGESVLLGTLDLGGSPVHLFAAQSAFSALSPQGETLWTTPIDGGMTPKGWITATVLAEGLADAQGKPAGRLVYASSRGVSALDAASGAPLWRWTGRTRLLEPPLTCDAGVVVVCSLDKGEPPTLTGLDLAKGTLLWEHACPGGLWAQPVVGEGLAVLLPKDPGTRRAEVLELATGTVLRLIDVGGPVLVDDRRGAWIEEQRLILPRFSGARGKQEAIAAFDLDSGTPAWQVPVDDKRELDSIVRCEGATYVLYIQSSPDAAPDVLIELDTRIGAMRPIPGVAIQQNDMPIGVRAKAVTHLSAPYLFLRSAAPDSKEMLVRAVHLPYGQRWAWRMPGLQDELYGQALPLPAVSARIVAIAFDEGGRAGSRRPSQKTQLVLLDRDSGTLREGRVLNADLGRADALELATLGDLLVVRGVTRTMVLAGDEVEEQR